MRLKVLTSFGNSDLSASAGEEINVDDEKFAKALLDGGLVEEIQSDSSATTDESSSTTGDDAPTETSEDQPEQETPVKTETSKSNKSKKGKK